MTLSREEMKKQAIECLHSLEIKKSYIKEFTEENKIYLFENCGGAVVEPDVKQKIEEIEQKTGCLVYAVEKSGQLYSFLLVSEYPEDAQYSVMKWGTFADNNLYKAYAYVWDRVEEFLSEFGMVALVAWGGGIKRIY